MKKRLLLVIFLGVPLSIIAMECAEVPYVEKNEDTSLLRLSEITRKRVLRLVMGNCVTRGNYPLVSCIFAALYPERYRLKPAPMIQNTIEDTSVLTLPRGTRAFVLRLVMLNCLLRGDYEGVSHIIEKTKLHPGSFFIGRLDKGPVLGSQVKPFLDYPISERHHLVHKLGFGVSYCLYKAAIEAGHKRLIRLLKEERTLGRIVMYADAVFEDSALGLLVLYEPQYDEQIDEYNQSVTEHDNRLLIALGKKPMTNEEHEASDRKAVRDWLNECRAKNGDPPFE